MAETKLEHTARQIALVRRNWIILLGVALVNIIWVLLGGWSIDPLGYVTRLPIFVIGFSLLGYYKGRRFDPNIHVYIHSQLQLIALYTIVGDFSYLSASLALPLWDEWLIRFDGWMGFDWLQYLSWSNDHASIARILEVAYPTLSPQVMLLPVVLFLCKKPDYLLHFMMAFIVSLIVTLIIAAAFPAVAGYMHYEIDLKHYPTLHAIYGFAHQKDFLALRDGSLHVLNGQVKGIVTFPSFHATGAVLLAYALRAVPLLFPLGLMVNGLLIISAMQEGGHYLTDLVGGVLIGVAAILLARRWLPLANAKP